jgi:hypothetical protein
VTPYLLPLLFKVDEVSETGQYSWKTNRVGEG